MSFRLQSLRKTDFIWEASFILLLLFVVLFVYFVILKDNISYKHLKQYNIIVEEEKEDTPKVATKTTKTSSNAVSNTTAKTYENDVQAETITSKSENELVSTEEVNVETISTEITEVEEIVYSSEPFIIQSTAYASTGNTCADGTWPSVGETLAGKREWLGRHCRLYYVNSDGTIGDLIGSYTFHDTGWGTEEGGEIWYGKRIDIYMENRDICMNWGVKNVYIEFLD